VIFELRWAKETDVDPAKTVVYLPPLPVETPDGVYEMIGNGGDTTEIDRLIAALKRAKRAMLGTDTGADGLAEGKISVEQWANAHGFSETYAPNVASGGAGATPGKYEDEVDPVDVWAAKDAVQEESARELGWESGIPSHALLSYKIAGNRLVTWEDQQAASRVEALLEEIATK
jgi:hypothetical protein